MKVILLVQSPVFYSILASRMAARFGKKVGRSGGKNQVSRLVKEISERKKKTTHLQSGWDKRYYFMGT